MTTSRPKAFLFDLNGTMIDDMAFHTKAWHNVLNNELGANLTEAQVKAEMYGKNSELLVRVFGPNHFSDAEIERLSQAKEAAYRAAFLPQLKLLPGLAVFLETARSTGIRMGIGSAAIPENVAFVLDGLNLRSYFDAIVSAADVAQSKPHPETFLKGAQLLAAAPENCIVFEDAPNGVEAALHAGMQAVVLTTMHEAHEFSAYPNILHFITDYTDPVLQNLFAPATV